MNNHHYLLQKFPFARPKENPTFIAQVKHNRIAQEMEKLLNDFDFQKVLTDIATQTDTEVAEVKAKASEYLKELHTVHHPFANLVGVQFTQYVLSRGYDKSIDINPNQVRQLAKIARKHPVAFVMTHKTYIDMLVLTLVLVRHGLPIPHIFAGINMDFLGLGQFARQNGVIFIRRSIKDNLIYKASLRHYIAHLVKQKGHFMWAIEGTRSRTGKLVWPKMGILKYIKEAEAYANQEVKYVPVSIVYDLIPDVKEMTLESRGKQKSPESLKWFLNYIRKLSDNYGRISLRIGEPVDMTGKSAALKLYKIAGQKIEEGGISHLALELVHHINQVTPVTTTSLICMALISKFSLTKRGIESDLAVLMQLIENQKPDALVDRGQQIGTSVQKALNLLLRAGILQQKGDTLNAKYIINPAQFLQATYYANMSVHHFYHRAFAELALLKMEEEKGYRNFAFWKEIMDLRDLFKFEFFYSRKINFTDEVEANLDFMFSDWQTLTRTSEKGINKRSEHWRALTRADGKNVKNHLQELKILVAPVVLYSYIDAYRVVIKALQSLSRGEVFEEDKFLEQCIFLGEEMHWQGRIQRLESVAKPFLQNGLRFAKNLSLIPSTEDTKEDALRHWANRLDDVAQRINELQAITLKRPQELTPYVPLEREAVPGSRTESVTKDLLATSESGAHIGAFFDLDRTLISDFSAKQFFQSRLLSGKMSAREIIAQFAGVIVYARGQGNFAGLAAISAKGIRGVDEDLFVQMGEEVYVKYLATTIYPEARAMVAAHLSKGHTIAIISAATPYQVNPIARDLGIEHVMCTRLEVEKGKFTGNIVEPACWGDGKAHAAKELAEKYDLDLSKSYFYTDSAEDLPLLEIVGHPRPMNPDTKLAALSFKNGWPVYRFDEEDSSTNLMDLTRTGLALGSLFPAVVRAVINGITSMSWEEGINAMVANVGDLVISVSGIELAVKGEENLWAQRPAVFMFNHQSSVDLFIAAKLIRKDLVGIAKKELQRMPIIGQLMTAAGVIFIDRKNRQKAIEAMQPAVDALHNGKSIVIFPEGTRSKNYALGKFKKGGFHLAMQAGVPIIPVVVRNAYDAMPRGSRFLKSAAVEVVVCSAIPTKDWSLEDLPENVNKVRKIFLEELGQ